MLRHDLVLYQAVLRRLSLGELMALYERTAPEHEALARVIAEELTLRLGGVLTEAV